MDRVEQGTNKTPGFSVPMNAFPSNPAAPAASAPPVSSSQFSELRRIGTERKRPFRSYVQASGALTEKGAEFMACEEQANDVAPTSASSSNGHTPGASAAKYPPEVELLASSLKYGAMSVFDAGSRLNQDKDKNKRKVPVFD
jgi:hypothetical protein